MAEGRVNWAFWPPTTPPEHVASVSGSEGNGIWIPRGDSIEHDDTDSESDGEDRCETEEEETERGEDSDLLGDGPIAGLGRFGALSLSGDEETDQEV